MKPLRKIAFVTEGFSSNVRAYHLLDRFLIGYPRDGEFHSIEDCQITLHNTIGDQPDEMTRRARDFGLVIQPSVAAAVSGADGAVVVWRNPAEPVGKILDEVLAALPRGSSCFVHGVLAKSVEVARESQSMAKAAGILLRSGTGTAVTYRNPEPLPPAGQSLSEALVVVQGATMFAELEGLQGLMPFIERRPGSDAAVSHLANWQRAAFWNSLENTKPFTELLAAAISRSQTIQGDPVKDGRTQEIVVSGLIKSLVSKPRGWLLYHDDGLRSVILVLDGACTDFNVAVRTHRGVIHSAQLYRPPAPMQDQYSRMAAVIEEMFRTGQAPWAESRDLLIADLLKRFATA